MAITGTWAGLPGCNFYNTAFTFKRTDAMSFRQVIACLSLVYFTMISNITAMKKSFLVLSIAALPVCLGACKKEGVLQTEPEIMKVSVNSYWADPEALSSLTLSNTLLIDSISQSKANINNVIIGKTGGQQHLQLRNLKTGEIWIDSLLDIPGHFLSMRILQLQQEDAPQLIIGGDETPDPAKRNIGFNYSDPDLPETLTLELYRVIVQAPNIIVSGTDEPIALFEHVQRGKFTGFTVIDYYTDFEKARFVFKLKDEKTNEYLPNADAIDPLRYQKGGRMSVPSNMSNFDSYIFSIRRNVAGSGNITYNTGLLVSY